jgi:hypothetical protein
MVYGVAIDTSKYLKSNNIEYGFRMYGVCAVCRVLFSLTSASVFRRRSFRHRRLRGRIKTHQLRRRREANVLIPDGSLGVGDTAYIRMQPPTGPAEHDVVSAVHARTSMNTV